MAALDLAALDLADLDLANLDLANLDLANLDLANLDLANLDLANLDLANLDHDDRGVLTHLEAHHGTSVTTRNRPLGGLPGAAPQRRAAPHEHPP